MTPLSEIEIEDLLRTLPDWKVSGGALRRDYTFPDFVAAMRFVNQLAELAEEAGHHPDIDIRYNRVSLGLVTHDAGGITANDTKMAARISQFDS